MISFNIRSLIFFVFLSCLLRTSEATFDCTTLSGTRQCLNGTNSACLDATTCKLKNCILYEGVCDNCLCPPGNPSNCIYPDCECVMNCTTFFPEAVCSTGDPTTCGWKVDTCQVDCTAIGKICSGIDPDNMDPTNCVLGYGNTCVNSGAGKIKLIHASQILTENKTEVLNAGDTLTILARAHGKGKKQSIANHKIVGYVVTKNDAPTSISVSLSTGGSPASLKVNKGLLVYDTINGNAEGFDHFIVRTHFPFYETSFAASGLLTLYIPSLVTQDAGTYYITFMDGSGLSDEEGSTAIVSSKAFNLVVNTKTNAGSRLMCSVYFKIILTILIAWFF